MRAFITGGGGFVGGHLARHLIACGDETTSVDKECDVTSPLDVRHYLGSSTPDVIYHLAALTHVGDSWKDPVDFTRVNVLGTKNLLDVAHEVCPEAVVILVSSSDVYGVVSQADLPLRETFRTAPANPYASSKLESEHFAHEAWRTRGQRVIIARPFNHLGPGQSTKFVVPALVSRLLHARAEGARSIPVGDLSTRRDFSDVRDVVRAYRLLATYARAGEIYNIASGVDTSLNDIAAILRAEIAPDVELVVDPELLRPVEIPVMRGSFEKLHEETGWEPSLALLTSLHDVINDLRGATTNS
ncbi:MAG: GDP-mannose 4,6-dehydratase [Acidimicrobiales bacterium]